MNLKIKKAAVISLCCILISTSTVFAVTNNLNINSDIKININNEWVQVSLNPFIENDRTLVSLNEFIEKLGANLESDLKTETIKIYTDEVTIELTVEKNSAKIIKNDGGSLVEETINLEIEPRLVNEKFFVPLRFAAETLGFYVKWDNALRAVIIKETGDIINVERPIDFEIVDRQSIDDNALLLNLLNKNYMTKGMYSLMDGEYIYVMVSAGERPTGGYRLAVDSITEVTPGTAYIHANLNSPEEGSMVTQALTYPTVMIKFEKGNIKNIQWDLSGDINSDEAEKNEVIKFVQSFGSSPWPERIDVLAIEKINEGEYVVNGDIIEFTSVEIEEGGIAAKREITLIVKKADDRWVIIDAELGNYEE